VAAVGSRNMMGGSEPNMADLAVYGALNGIEDITTFKEVMIQSKIAAWYQRMAHTVNK
jgi:microsomal prostaglandin-E synthase 2